MSSFQDKDYYSALGIDSNIATPDQIKSAYKKLALNWHPDRNKEPGADEMFKIISEAYEVLSCPEKKRRYDDYIRSRVFTHNPPRASTNPHITPFGVTFGPDFTMSFTSRFPYQFSNGSGGLYKTDSSYLNPFAVPYSSLRASYPNGLYSNAVNRQQQQQPPPKVGVVNITNDSVTEGVNYEMKD